MARNVTAEQIRSPDAPLTCLTCYDYLTARVMDRVEDLDMILVGDTLGMVTLGYDSTVPVTVDDMVHHTAAVSRGVDRVFLVSDVPFLEMAKNPDHAVEVAQRLMQDGGAQAVKIEGGERAVENIQRLVNHDVPVVGHLGLTPQSVESIGGYRVQARSTEDIRQLGQDARKLQEVGVTALVLECVPAPVATALTDVLEISTIGIGAGDGCDGQVLVWQDMMGLSPDPSPRFVRTWGNFGENLQGAVEDFCSAVQNRDFPDDSESYALPDSLTDVDLRSLLMGE